MGTKERAERIADVARCVRQLRACEKEALITEVMLKYNTARRTVLEYIKLLVSAEKMREKDGWLRWGKA